MRKRGYGYKLTCGILCLISSALVASIILSEGGIDDLFIFILYLGPLILSICLIVFNVLSKKKKLFHHLYLVALLLLCFLIFRTMLWLYFFLGLIGVIFGFIGYFKGLKK